MASWTFTNLGWKMALDFQTNVCSFLHYKFFTLLLCVPTPNGQTYQSKHMGLIDRGIFVCLNEKQSSLYAKLLLKYQKYIDNFKESLHM